MKNSGLILSMVGLIGATRASCGKKSKFDVGKTSNHHIMVNDTNFGETKRKFIIDVPKGYDHDQKTPIFFYQHGWSCSGIGNENYLKEN